MTKISVVSWMSGKPLPDDERKHHRDEQGLSQQQQQQHSRQTESSSCLLYIVIVLAVAVATASSLTASILMVRLLNSQPCPSAVGSTTTATTSATTTDASKIGVTSSGRPETSTSGGNTKAPEARLQMEDRGNTDGKTPFSFEDMFDTSLVPKSPHGQFVGNNEVTYFNEKRELVLHHIENDTKTVIMTNETFIKYQTSTYKISPDKKYILITYDIVTELQDLYMFAKHKVYDRESGTILSFPNNDNMKDKIVMVAAWTPTGSGLTFVFDNDLYHQDGPTAVPERLTTSGSNEKVRNGLGFWNSKGVGNAYPSFFWSPDGSKLAYAEYNSTDIPLSQHPIYKQRMYPDEFRQVYLKSGDASHFGFSQIYIIDMKDSTRPKKSVSPPNEFKDEQHYIYALMWKNNDEFAVGWTNRIQKRSLVQFCEVKTSSIECKKNHDMTVENGWFAGPHLVTFVHGGADYLGVLPKVVGDKGRYRQVAMVSSNDGSVTFLTDKAMEVYFIIGYDNEKHLIYYTGNSGLQLDLHVYRVGTPRAAEGARAVKCLTCDEGSDCSYTSATFSPCAKNYLLTCNGPALPKHYLRWTNDDSKSYTVMDNADVQAKLAKKNLPTKEYHMLDIGDGYKGWAEFILPPNMVKDGSVKYPVMFYPYAGPHGTTQGDYSYKGTSQPGGLWDYHLASSHNVVVIRLNGRGSGGRGDEFLFQLYRRLGTKEITDQIDGARSLARDFSYVDADKFAIWGWSYGGFTTAHAIGHESDVFKCGISVAPVTNFRYYYSGYTERYMDLDTWDDNEAGYNGTDVLRKAENFKNKKYMIAHGTIDDNVHFQNAIELINALTEAQVLFRTHTMGNNNRADIALPIYLAPAKNVKIVISGRFKPGRIYVDQNHGIQNFYQRRHLFLSMNDFYLRECLGRNE